MITPKNIALAVGVCAAGFIAGQPAFAQSTDGFHTINAGNVGPNLPYRLHCRSGSGHTLGDIIEYNVADENF